jgi:hypothetical protein
LHDNSGCLFIFGFGTRKIFSKYESLLQMLSLIHRCFQSDLQCGRGDSEHAMILSMGEDWLNETSEWIP